MTNAKNAALLFSAMVGLFSFAIGCRPNQTMGSDLQDVVSNPDDLVVPMPAAFATACANTDPQSEDVRDMLVGIHSGPIAFSAGTATIFPSSSDCAVTWAKFVKTPVLLFDVHKDIGCLEILADVPNLNLTLLLSGMPKNLGVLQKLKIRHLGINPPDDAAPSFSSIERSTFLATFLALPNLVELNLDRMGFSDLSALKPLVKLAAFAASDSQIGDLSFLTNWPELKDLELHNNNISDLTPLSGLLEMTYIDLSGNQISKLDPLFNLANLESLNLDRNPTVENLLAVQYLPNLKRLNAESSNIKNIDPLKSLPLEYLDLNNNPVESIESLRKLPLRMLYLRNSNVTDLAPVTELAKLVVLNVSGTKVKILPKLDASFPLATLDLLNTKVTNFCPALVMPKIANLRLPNGKMLSKFEIQDGQAHCNQ